MKEPVEILECLIKDCARECSAAFQWRDIETIKSRYRDEGLSFLTITLPKFVDDIMSCIENGQNSLHFLGWKKCKCLPAFLQGFTNLIFTDVGENNDEKERKALAIRAIRQIGLFYKKINVACASKRQNDAFEEYIRIDEEIPSVLSQIAPNNLERFTRISRIVVGSIFGESVIDEKLIPHHGPGSTAEKIRGNGKYHPMNQIWYSKLDSYFSQSDLLSSEEWFNFEAYRIKQDNTRQGCSCVRVTSVPKTQKTPRIIALEPVIIQFYQQGIKDYMVPLIEHKGLTAGHVNFTDQTVNQTLALKGSINRRNATLDLSSASDRVPNELIKLMFKVNPHLSDLIQVTRSEYALIAGRELLLNKFASMGSALCFPVESLYFFILCIDSALEQKGLQISFENIKKVSKGIYVYGDDIIIPVEQAEGTIAKLALFGSIASLSKSFWKSSFRESCGIDAYDGTVVTPSYVRRPVPSSKRDSARLISWIDLANQLIKKGYLRTACCIIEHVESIVGILPTVQEESEGLGWIADLFGRETKIIYNSKWMRSEVRTLTVRSIREKDRLTDHYALYKCLLMLARRKVGPPNPLYPSVGDSDHLDTSSRFGAVTLKHQRVLAACG